MEKLINTSRGYISLVNNLPGLDSTIKNSNFLIFDWPLAIGCIPVPEVNRDILVNSFNWSLANGFIEEDALVHAAMSIFGFHENKDIRESILSPSNFPKLFDFKNIDPSKFAINVAKKNSIQNLTYFSFPSSAAYIDCIYPIVDSLELLKEMFNVGAKMVQFRVKKNFVHNIEELIKQACSISLNHPNSKLFINDHWELAIKNNAFGVHLGQEDLFNVDMKALEASGLHLGLSTHSYWEVSRAVRFQPSYIACGPIFETRAKKMPWKPQGLQNLKYWARVLDIPVVGIGGINLSNIKNIKNSKCSGVAVIDAITNCQNPNKCFNDLNAIWK